MDVVLESFGCEDANFRTLFKSLEEVVSLVRMNLDEAKFQGRLAVCCLSVFVLYQFVLVLVFEMWSVI